MTNDFRYYNRNPEKGIEADCVCRAISIATRLPYITIEKLIEISSYYYGCESLCVSCYQHLLEDVFHYPGFDCKGYTVGELSEKYENNVLLCRIDGHLTCCSFGKTVDIWDCTKEKVKKFWICY